MLSLTRNLWSPFFLLFLLTGRLGATQAKKLVVLVGPHGTKTYANSFLSEYAPNDESRSPSFDGWSWPVVESVEQVTDREYVFDVLIKEPDSIAQDIIIDGIRSAWEESENGVFIGSLDFDKVGDNPYSGYDPVEALSLVVDEVGISPQDVNVIITNRIPRTEHWGMVWWSHFDAETYEDFVCLDEQSDKRWEWLDTVMNPFMLAKAYHDQEWNVTVLDQDSILKAGKNVAHTIACFAMDYENCDDGWVVGIDREIPDPLEVQDIGLSETDLSNLETMFLYRDCNYVSQLQDSPRFEMVGGPGMIQSQCNDSKSALFAKATETDFLLNAIQSQKGCEQNDIDIESFLAGMWTDTYDDTTVESTSTFQPTGSDTDEDGEVSTSYTGSASQPTDRFDNLEKHLIVVAGPHETASKPTNKFFSKHATSLGGWTWPTVDPEMIDDAAPHHTFDYLVTEADSLPVQNLIMDGIRNSWNEADKGVIIGSNYFERVGKNPETSYDALGAVDRVVRYLDIFNDDVTIAVNYRSSRIDHLSAVWWNHFDSYTLLDFICHDNEEEKRWEWIDTVMNPLKVADAYVKEGWNVALIEQEGTLSAGKDVSHSVACNFMDGVNCENGWIPDLASETTENPESYEIAGFDKMEISTLNRLFLMRDCFYKNKLESNDKFSTVNRKELWKSCSSRLEDDYEKLVDTSFVIDVMKSLQGCDDGVDPEAWDFADKFLKSRPPMSDKTLLIVILLSLSLFVLLVAVLLKMKLRRRMKAPTSLTGPPEGIFRDDPTSLSPYTDNTGGEAENYQDDEDTGELENVNIEESSKIV